MEYKVILPKYKKWFRILPVIPLFFACILLVFLPLHISRKLNKPVNSSLARDIVLTIIVLIVLNYLYSKISHLFTNKSKVSINQNSIQLRFFFIKTRIIFSSIKKIEILNKENIPKGVSLLFETGVIKGIKIICKRTWWNRGFLCLYNIDNFDRFIEEIKGKLPYHLVQDIS